MRRKPVEPASTEMGVFGGTLKMAREEAAFTQSDIANEVGYSQTAVVMWEMGRHSPPPEVVFKLERILHQAPGALSQHLGYVPVELSGKRPTPRTVADILVSDDSLDDRGRRAVLDLYKTLRASR